MVLEIMGTWQR